MKTNKQMVEPPSEESILPNNKWSFNEAVK